MTPIEINAAWGRRVVADKAWLLHTPTLAIGPAEEFFDGVNTVHTSDVNDMPVRAPVVKLLTGHALLSEPNKFVELSTKEVAFYQMAVEQMTGWMKGAVEHAAEKGIQGHTVMTLLVSLLQAQLRALQLNNPQPDEVM